MNAVVNHDGFRHRREPLRRLCRDGRVSVEANYYATTTRYATSAFLRLKMQEALSRRGVAPHVFERRSEAHAFLEAAERDARDAAMRPEPAAATPLRAAG